MPVKAAPLQEPSQGVCSAPLEKGKVAAHTALLNTHSSDSVNTHLKLFIAIIKWEFSYLTLLPYLDRRKPKVSRLKAKTLKKKGAIVKSL